MIGVQSMFPLSIEGTIDVPADGADVALSRVRVAAAAIGAKSIEQQSHRLVFRGAVFNWPFSWNVLVPLDQCEMKLVSNKLSYNCSLRAFAAVLAMLIAIFFILWRSSLQSDVPIAASMAFAILAWAAILFWSYTFAGVRVRAFFTRAVWAMGRDDRYVR